jgi:hypothetical protein|tara:strand:+ start:2755 stop:3495 length:741 start_codon:yes stop_codon:yes gene_type:complete
MATNLFFNNYAFSQEQNLIEDLIIESIKIYGYDCYYLPRTLVAEDTLFGEDTLSKFDNAYSLEMYVKSVDGFEGEGDFLSKFNIEIRDEMVLTVSQRRFGEEVDVFNTTEDIGRPSEGDLIYFPLNNKIFEVKFVEHESIFYQMGSLQTYDLRCELFEYSHERLDTGINVIDSVETAFSGDMLDFQLLDEEGNELITEDGFTLSQDGLAFRVEDTDKAANNEQFSSNSIDFIDFSETNPFSEGGSW